jgi:hypothetical protein
VLGPGSLAGTHVGATASATVLVDVGAHALIGGSGNTVALQSLSVEGNQGSTWPAAFMQACKSASSFAARSRPAADVWPNAYAVMRPNCRRAATRRWEGSVRVALPLPQSPIRVPDQNRRRLKYHIINAI